MLNAKKMLTLLAATGVQPGSKMLVAVSGGADSLALLDLLVQVRARLNLQLTACHINHELRAASVTEEQRVRQYCDQVDVPLQVRHWPAAMHPATGTEAAAREFRYQIFADLGRTLGCDVVLTAHHRDDQVETVLFRLVRSGDVRSVQGIASVREFAGMRLVRPLLQVTKAELRAYADAHNLPYSDDASNADTHFSRNFLRHEIMPRLQSVDAQAPAHIARFAEEQAGLVELAAMTTRHFLNLLGPKSDEIDWTVLHTESHPLQKLVLSSALRQLTPAVSAKQVDAVFRALSRNDGVTRSFQLSKDVEIRVQGLHVTSAQPSVAVPVSSVTINALEVPQPFMNKTIVATTAVQPGDKVLAQDIALPVTIRKRAPGDRLELSNGHHQLLRRWLINQHVDLTVRNQLLVAAQASNLLWCGTIDGNQLWHGLQTAKIKSSLVLR